MSGPENNSRDGFPRSLERAIGNDCTQAADHLQSRSLDGQVHETYGDLAAKPLAGSRHRGQSTRAAQGADAVSPSICPASTICTHCQDLSPLLRPCAARWPSISAGVPPLGVLLHPVS